ncbi:unnamed protein product [Lepeophtheirus salmonis]|uniref:(salmon louse) hypothetical protein n=1 Tax=Lepeophtheirus salmonis TaxID=72036 RepID=A0A7R8CTF3_LEPSM|nr:unnamed protein product [Lepeophtheirus salmonis]CAF2922922.1 unnamed protein product [Lepeophtheirus salmonis]
MKGSEHHSDSTTTELKHRLHIFPKNEEPKDNSTFLVPLYGMLKPAKRGQLVLLLSNEESNSAFEVTKTTLDEASNISFPLHNGQTSIATDASADGMVQSSNKMMEHH